MSLNLQSAYRQITPEEEAHIDALCDRFEQAWKETKAGGLKPRVANYMGDCSGAAREVLFQELAALEDECRQRYGSAIRSLTANELGGAANIAAAATTLPQNGHADGAVRWQAGWLRIPGLLLVETLGSGGMGVVFKARQEKLNRDVAVKLLRDDHKADSGQRERFLQEARAVARLRHPHLVQVFEFGELPGSNGALARPYLVLEYVSGGSLADLLHGLPQPPIEAARLVETIADAIHYAHQQGIIHRDLKPANVLLQRPEVKGVEQIGGRGPHLLTRDICAKVTDFGLAKILSGNDLTQSGDVLGTPSYMAPEQAGGKGEAITAAVDVYGLGAILYETLTGRPPFAAETAVATLGLVREGEPVPPRRLQPTVPRDLETICLKCLRKEAGRRYATAQDLADDLRRFQAGEPVRARPVGTGERVIRWCRRSPRVAALVAALVLVFLAGSAGVLWQWQRADRNAYKAQRDRDAARQEKERAERRLQMVHDRVDRLKHLGQELLRQPGQYRTGQAVLEEALVFYQNMLPEEGNDPRMRKEAAQLLRQVAEIYNTLGQTSKAADAFEQRTRILSSLLEEDPTNKALRMALADSNRWLGTELRWLGKPREAREAYDRAAELHESLMREFPNEAGFQVALANTLLNKKNLLSRREQAKEIERLFQRILELNRAAVRAAPDNSAFQAELALELEDQGGFFLATGRVAESETVLREALAIHQSLLNGAHRNNSMERFTAGNDVNLGKTLAAGGNTQEAEKCFRQAVYLLDRPVTEFPESALRRAALAETLALLANFLRDNGRQRETEEIRRSVIRHFETLKAEFPEDPAYRRKLVRSYLEWVTLLCELGRKDEAAEPLRLAREVDPEDHFINNDLAWFLATNSEPRLRDAAEAVKRAQKAVAAQPQDGDYKNTLGVAYYRNGDDKSAVAELEKAMSLRSGGDSLDWFFLAMIHLRLGNRDEARMWFDRAVKWMDKNNRRDDELRRFRAEAEALLAEPGKR